MGAKPQSDDKGDLPAAEVARRRDAAIRRMLATPKKAAPNLTQGKQTKANTERVGDAETAPPSRKRR